MKVGSELRKWLSDRDAQRRARAEADAFASGWNEGASNRAIAKAMARLPDRSAETITAAVCGLFDDESALDALISGVTDAQRHDPFFEPPFRHLNTEIHDGIVLYEDENVSIAIGVTSVVRLAEKKNRKAGGSIGFSGAVDIFKFVRASGARLAFWESPRITSTFTVNDAGRCRQTARRAIHDGETLVVDGRYQSFIIEHASTNLVVIQATVKVDRAPVAVEYDGPTGAYLGCSAADDNASRIQMIITLLRKLDCATAFQPITEFLAHPDFFVRWHVMRELLGLDAEAALPHLRRMAAGDPHPDTRRAARATLDRIERPQGRARRAA